VSDQRARAVRLGQRQRLAIVALGLVDLGRVTPRRDLAGQSQCPRLVAALPGATGKSQAANGEHARFMELADGEIAFPDDPDLPRLLSGSPLTRAVVRWECRTWRRWNPRSLVAMETFLVLNGMELGADLDDQERVMLDPPPVGSIEASSPPGSLSTSSLSRSLLSVQRHAQQPGRAPRAPVC
jgi:hypothetical protein